MKRYHWLWPQTPVIDGRYYIAHREKRLVVSPFAFLTVPGARGHLNRMENQSEYTIVEAAQIQSND